MSAQFNPSAADVRQYQDDKGGISAQKALADLRKKNMDAALEKATSVADLKPLIRALIHQD
jgi:hypothetical protein